MVNKDNLNEYDIAKNMISQIKLMNTKQTKKKYINE